MDTIPSDIAASFDVRAETYNKNEWHRQCAEQLVRFCEIGPGQSVLDAGTGTGFAAIAAARAVGSQGRVVGIDASAGMLRVARCHEADSSEASVQWVRGNAVDLPGYASGSFDAVLCAAALLYMPVAKALSEWHRLLAPGGCVAFSSMKSGQPVAGAIFRTCAASFGIRLDDPSEPLGSEALCRLALGNAGFSAVTLSSAKIAFSTQDGEMAWESNLLSAAHEAVRKMESDSLARMRVAFETALTTAERRAPGSTAMAELLFAKGIR